MTIKYAEPFPCRWEEARAVGCPRCGSVPGALCTYTHPRLSGITFSYFHRERWNAGAR